MVWQKNEICSCEFNFQVGVLNSVEPVVVASAEKEEFVATSWEGKEMDELLKDVKGKGEPSQLHVKSVGNFPRRKKELFKNLKDRITPSKNPESLQAKFKPGNLKKTAIWKRRGERIGLDDPAITSRQ